MAVVGLADQTGLGHFVMNTNLPSSIFDLSALVDGFYIRVLFLPFVGKAKSVRTSCST